MVHKQRLLLRCLLIIATACSSSCLFSAECDPGVYSVGAAQADITGPIVGLGMLGYVNFTQVDQGLHMRLRARALVVSESCSNKTIALVIDDVAMIFGGVKRAVLERLATDLPGVFNDANLLLSATHTHSGPGGYSHHGLYNLTTLGFSPQSFDAIVSGTARAILQAYRQRQGARLFINSGTLSGLQFNRSPEAYDNNPETERAHYDSNVDSEMTLLAAVGEDGRPLAAFNWYPVHGVSLPMSNKLVSGDNKGMASYLFERQMGATYRRDAEFVAGFLQANSGDISPYPLVKSEQEATDGYLRNRNSGQQQYAQAHDLFASAAESLQGPLSYAHRFEDLAYRQLPSGKQTCNGALGIAFAAGTENGRPVKIFHEGSIYGLNWPRITLLPQEQACHAEKILLLPTGFAKPEPLTAQIAPFQLIRIGELAIIAAPFEITTMAGRRLKESVLATLAPFGVKHVALTGLANEYLHYVTTREEYAKQSYEGGSTLFGPWSLTAYTEIFKSLSQTLITGINQPGAAIPPRSAAGISKSELNFGFDIVPPGKHFGEVAAPPQEHYRQGDAVQVSFHGARPVHSAPQSGSFLTVEHWQEDLWQPLLYDWDPETQARWQSTALNIFEIHIRWDIDSHTPLGIYRICHNGERRTPYSAEPLAYSGCTKEFNIIKLPKES